MTSVHTSDLDHAIADALHTAERVVFTVTDWAADGTPAEYRVTAWRAGAQFISRAATPTEALARAMQLLRAATGDGPHRIVDFASIEFEGEVSDA